MNSGGGLLGDALDVLGALGEESGALGHGLLDLGVEDATLFMARIHIQERGVGLGAQAQVDKKRQIAAVVQDHVGGAVVTPLQDLPGVVPVFLEGLALGGEHGHAEVGDGRGGVVLRAEDVAGTPADVGTQGGQRLDEHGGLDGHVQGSGDAGALEGLAGAELLAGGDQAGHLGLGQVDFLATEGCQSHVAHEVVGLAAGHGGLAEGRHVVEHVHS